MSREPLLLPDPRLYPSWEEWGNSLINHLGLTQSRNEPQGIDSVEVTAEDTIILLTEAPPPQKSELGEMLAFMGSEGSPASSGEELALLLSATPPSQPSSQEWLLGGTDLSYLEDKIGQLEMGMLL